MKKIMLYYHHFGGLGHGTRILSLCKMIKKSNPDYKIVVINSGKPQPELRIKKYATIINLPPFEAKTGLFDGIKSAEDINVTFRKRGNVLEELAGMLKPDIAIFEHFPFGRGALINEIIKFIKKLKGENALVYSSVRDIIDQKIDINELEENLDLFNGIFVHSDEKDGFITSFKQSQKLKSKLIFCGRAFSKVKKELISKKQIREQLKLSNEKLIVASIGGGIDGFEILETLIELKAKIDQILPCLLLVCTGPSINPELFENLKMSIEGRDILLAKFNENYLDYVNAADLSISMGGYNSVNGALLTGVPSIIIPRKSDLEQKKRTEIFSEYFDTISINDLKTNLESKIIEILSKKKQNKKYLIGNKYDGFFPKIISKIGSLKYLKLRITNYCDCSCDMCSWVKIKKQNLPYSTITKIVDDACKLGVNSINLTGGEPTIHPKFKEIVTYIKSRGLSLSLSTNLGFNKRILNIITEKQIDCIDFSLDSSDSKLFDFWRGSSGLLSRIIKNVKLLKMAVPNISLIVNFTLRNDNIDFSYKILDFCEKNGINKISFHPVEETYLNKNKLSQIRLSEESITKFYLEVVPKLLSSRYNVKIEISPFFKTKDSFNYENWSKQVIKNFQRYKEKIKLLHIFLNNSQEKLYSSTIKNSPCNITESLRVDMYGRYSPCCRLDRTVKFGKVEEKNLFNFWVNVPYVDKLPPFKECSVCWNNNQLFDILNKNGRSSLKGDSADNKLQNVTALKNGKSPKKIQVEFDIPIGCNANCIMCDGRIRKSPIFSYKNVKKYLRYLDTETVSTIKLLGGEPTLDRKGLVDFIYSGTKSGFEIVFQTNGYLLSKSYINELVAAGLSKFQFSIDSDIPEQHDKIRGLPGCFNRVVESIKYIKSKYHEMSVCIDTVIMKENVDRIFHLVGFLINLDVNAITLTELEDYRKNYNDLSLSSKTYNEIRSNILNYYSNTKTKINFGCNQLGGEFVDVNDCPLCNFVSMKIKIGPGGELKPCPRKTLSGLYLNRPLRTLYKDIKFKNFIQKYLKGCGDCRDSIYAASRPR